MNKLITNILLAPTPSATGTIGAVVEDEVILLGLPPLSIRSNPSHPAIIHCFRATLFIMVGGTALGFSVRWTLLLKLITTGAIALQVDSLTRTIQTILPPLASVVRSSTTLILLVLVVWIIQCGINHACSVHNPLVCIGSGGRGSLLRQ